MDLEDESVQCCVTSPPYWGLRKYDGEQDSGGFVFGLEKSPEAYVEHTVLFLREIRRVLRDDGVCFWNVGDSYASGKGSCFNPGGGKSSLGHERKADGAHPLHRGNVSDLHTSGLKPKDLVMIPARVALAAQADGWWVRSDIVWAKPNPMPESVKDRPTSSYEHIFMFTKNAAYYWDIDAVREQGGDGSTRWGGKTLKLDTEGALGGDGHVANAPNRTGRTFEYNGKRNLRDVWTIATQPSGFKHYAAFPEEIPTRCIKAASRVGDTVLDPFAGTGRTLEVAMKLGRNAIGYEISEKYCGFIEKRCIERVLL